MKKLYNVQSKFMKQVIVLAMVLIAALPAVMKAQDGSESNPFPIKTAHQLTTLAERVNAGSEFYFNPADSVYYPNTGTGYVTIPAGASNMYFKLVADITLNNGDVAACDGVLATGWTAWPVLGNSNTHPFDGIIDGNKHTVSGVFVNQNAAYAGFIGITGNHAQIFNLGVVNSYISGDAPTGGLIGAALHAVVDSCFFSGTVVGGGTSATAGTIVGGLIGEASTSTSITHCASNAMVSGKSQVGGLIGRTVGAGDPCTITNCYSSSAVYGQFGYTGGAIGEDRHSGTIISDLYYDSQMVCLPSGVSQASTAQRGNGMATVAMTNGTWHPAGFDAHAGIYPLLHGFDMESNRAIYFAAVPIFLPESTTLSDLSAGSSIGLGGNSESVNWTLAERVGNVSLASAYQLSVEGQSYVALQAEKDGNTRSFVFRFDKEPLIGSATNPFTIDNLAELTAFRDGINTGQQFTFKHFTVPALGENTCFLQTADITMTSEDNWTSIGSTSEVPFKGTYDGGNNAVIGWKYTTDYASAFFAYTENATIKNLTIRNVRSTNRAALIYSMRGGLVDNCHAEGSSTVKGGLVYQTAVADNTAYIKNSTNRNSFSAVGHIGGILCRSGNTLTIIDSCHNYGNITSSAYESQMRNVGGIIGGRTRNTTGSFRVSHSSNHGAIKGGNDTYSYAAGISGSNGTITYCWNTGKVSGEYRNAGISVSATSISYCYNLGDVVHLRSDDGGWAYGISSTTPSYCFNAGNIEDQNVNNAYSISGGGATHCFNVGDVTARYGTVFAMVNNSDSKRYSLGRLSGRGVTVGGAYIDTTRVPLYRTITNANTNKSKTSSMIGTGLQTYLGTDNWVYADSVYPRIKGLHDLTISKVLSLPIFFGNAQDNVDNVTTNFTVRKDWGIEWVIEGTSGATISDSSAHLQKVTLPAVRTNGDIILAAKYADSVYYRIRLVMAVTPPTEALTIDNLAELKDFRAGINSGSAFTYKGTAVPAGGRGTVFKITDDITLDEANWSNIGNSSARPFRGTLDGQNHTISGLKQTNYITAGFFMYIEGGTVENLNLTDVNIVDCTSGGSICAFLSNGTLSNCTAQGTIKGGYLAGSSANGYVGGLVAATSQFNRIHACKSEVKLSSTQYTYVGGIVGQANSMYTVIDSCENGGSISGARYMGGITAIQGVVRKCVNYGTITTGSAANNVAGITALECNIYGCVNSGNINVATLSSAECDVAGIGVGTKVQNSYNVGTIKGSNARNVAGIYVGTQTCQNNYNAGQVTGTGTLGAIKVGNTNCTNCYYDTLMCTAGDTHAGALPKNTTQMCGTNLALGDGFVYEAGMYPRISGIENTPASLATASPVFLTHNEKITLVNHDFTMGGVNNHSVVWSDVDGGNTLQFIDGDSAHINTPGVATLGAAHSGVVYKKIPLKFKMDAFIIKNATELAHFRDGINSEAVFFYNAADSTYHLTLDVPTYVTVPVRGKEATFRVVNDIDLGGVAWTPIGNTASTKYFQGIFDGDNHTISNFTIYNQQYSGLFGLVYEATIKNLTIERAKNTSLTQYYVAALAGWAERSTIENVEVAHCNVKTSKDYIGAVSGQFSGVQISNVNVHHDTIQGDNRVGGIVGEFKNQKIADAYVSHCEVKAVTSRAGGVAGVFSQSNATMAMNRIYVDTTNVSGGNYVGGIVGSHGYNYGGTFNYAYVRGGTVTGTNYVGGISGTASGLWLNYASNSSRVKGNNYVGGISGDWDYAVLKNNSNTGDVEGAEYVGGLIGAVQEHCQSDGNIYASVNAGKVKGISKVGGITGSVRHTTDANGGAIQNCTNLGDVEGEEMVGGIIGKSQGENRGNANAGRITGIRYVGGLVGHQSQYEGFSKALRRCYSCGQVYGEEYVGNVAGYSEAGTITYCYYDKQMSSRFKGLGSLNDDATDVAEGKLTREMLNTGIQTGLGTTYFTFASGLYPRPKVIKDSIGAIVAATPVVLGDTVTAYTIPGTADYTIAPTTANSVVWSIEEGNALYVVAPAFKAQQAGMTVLAASRNGLIKKIDFVVGVSSDMPIIIKDYAQLVKFTQLINAGAAFAYNTTDSIFATTDAAGTGISWVPVAAGGEGFFFKLNFDPTFGPGSEWTGRIGTTAAPFKGDFNGNNHTITNLPNATADTCGFFGYNAGTIHNLTLSNTNMTNGSHNVVAALCGYNSGRIDTCFVKNGQVKGVHYVAAVAAVNTGYVTACYSSATVNGTDNVAGICAVNTNSIASSFNMGDVTATDTLAGGIAGFNSGSLTNTYNVGNIAATDYAGGLVGQSTSSDLATSYNAGQVKSEGSNVGGLVGNISGSNVTGITTIAYDDAMCSLLGSFQGGNSYNTVKTSTQNMVGNALQSTLGTSDWVYAANLYPRLNGLDTLNASQLSVTPVFLTPGENVQNVSHDFTVSTNNSTVTWTQEGSDALVLNVPNITLDHCGMPTLQATRGDEHKNVEMLINFTGAVEQRDTTCGEPYLWDVSGLTYTTSYTAVVNRTVDGCPYTYTLHVVIPAELQVTATSTPELCVDANDGTATAAVTGGLGSSYTYEWTDLDSVRATPLPTTATIEDLAPEHRYRVIVTDAVNTKHCTARDSVEVLAAIPLVASIDTVSAGCYGSVDGMFEISFSGGKAPYVLSWTGASSGSRNLADPQVRYSVTALNTGNHTVTVKDANNCTVTLSANLVQDDRLYTVTAFDTTKLYDGVAVNAARYTLTYGSNTYAKVASGSSITLDNGDVLTATVSRTNLTDAGTYSNQVSDVVVMRGSDDVTCQYNISSVNKSVVINKRSVTVTSADSTKFYNSDDPEPLTNHRVIVTGDGFTSADSALITYTWYGSQTLGGVSDNTFDINWNGVNSDNYTFNKIYGSLTVIKNGMLIVRAKNMNRTYDGTSSTFNSVADDPNVGYTVTAYYVIPEGDPRYTGTPADTIYGLGAGYRVEVTMNDGSEITMTNADTVNWRVTAIHAYYNDGTDHEVTTSFERIDTIHGVLQINPVEITMISEGDTSVYDGTTHTRPDVTVSGIFVGDEVTGTPTATGSITEVGEVLNAITYTTGTGYNARNYKITKTEGTLKVTPRPLYIEGVDVYVDYDGSEHTTTDFTYGNLVSGHSATGISYSATGTSIGEYDGEFSGMSSLLVEDGSHADVTSNYAPDYSAGKLYIRSPEKELKVISATVSEMYDGQPHTAQSYTVTYGYQPVASVDDNLHFKLPTGDTVVVIPSSAASQTNVGSKRNDFDFAITPAANSGIYTILARDTGLITVTPREVILRSLSLEKTYDATPIVYDTAVAVGNGFVEGEGATYTFSNPRTWTEVGSYRNDFDYSLNAGTDPSNYTFVKDTGLLVISKAELTVTAVNVTRAYGDPNVFDYEITGFKGSDDVSAVNGIDATHPSYECAGGQFANIGTYTITPVLDGLSADNYTFAPANGTLTVERRLLTVNAPSVTTQYDGTTHNQTTNSILGTITYTNLADDDVVDHVTMTYSRLDGGAQPMTCSSITIIHGGTTVVTDNYNVQVSDTSKLIVTKRDLTVKPKNKERTYNGSALVADEYEVTSGSVVTGDEISDVVYAGSQTDAGTSASTITQLRVVRGTTPVGDVCYNITLAPGTLTVTPKEVTVTADNNTKVYGATDPTPLTDTTVTGLVAGESASLITCTLSRESGEAVGHYVITPSGDATQGNYSVSYVNGDFEITKATLTVTVDAQTKVYGATDPTFTASISGLQNGDNETSIRESLDLQFSRESGENVGKYEISVSGSDLDNYNVTYVKDSLTITRAELTVTADDKTKVYGESDPTFTATLSGLQNGDTESAILTALGLTYSRQVGESVGSYLITASGPSELANYSVSYEQGSLAITKAPLTIKLDTTKNYDGAVFVSNYAAATDGYTITGLQGTATITAGTVTSSGSDAGTYVDSASTNYASITVEFATSDGIDNYNVTYDFKQVIIKADLTITINATKEYDQTALTVPYDSAIVSVEGLMTGDALTAGVVTTNAVDAATYTHTGGTVNITTDFATTLGIDNYEVTYNVVLIITPRTGVVVTVQEHGAEYEYDGSTHSADGYSISINDPLYQTSDFTFSGTASVTGTGTETGLNFYPMTLSASDFTNINPNFTNVTFTILDSALYIYPKLKATVTSVTGVSCPGATNGTATISVTGGKPTSGEYSFSLDGGLAEAFTAPHLFENLSAGSHTVVVTDSLNYTATANFTIDELAILTATIVTPAELCPNQGNYPVSVNVSGGTAPYTYTWTGAQDVNASATAVVQTEVNDGGTAYTVSVSILDANSCPIEANATFTVKPSVTKTTSLSDIVCPADMNITLRYGVYDTLLTLIEPTWTSNITAMPLTLVNDAPVTSRFAVREGHEDSTYTIHWHLVDTCGGDSLICTQTITVAFPACAGTVTDANGNSYEMVRLGANCWTRSNLDTPVPPTRSSANGEYKYNNDDALAAQFGLLYSWYAACRLPEGSSAEPTVVDGHVQGICPTGWALPTAEDFIIMVDAIGGVPHMKIADDNFWISGLGGALPSSGFDALGAGYYKSATDTFEGLMTTARFWTSTPASSTSGTAVQCAVCEGEDVLVAPKSDGYSVRCVKINE